MRPSARTAAASTTASGETTYLGWLLQGLEWTVLLSLSAWVVALLLGTVFGVLRNALPQIPGATFYDRLIVGLVVIVIVVGSLLEGIPSLIILGPVLYPVAIQMGIHGVHYAMVLLLSMGVGDSPSFSLFRVFVAALSYVFLTEFAHGNDGVSAYHVWDQTADLLVISYIVA